MCRNQIGDAQVENVCWAVCCTSQLQEGMCHARGPCMLQGACWISAGPWHLRRRDPRLPELHPQQRYIPFTACWAYHLEFCRRHGLQMHSSETDPVASALRNEIATGCAIEDHPAPHQGLKDILLVQT